MRLSKILWVTQLTGAFLFIVGILLITGCGKLPAFNKNKPEEKEQKERPILVEVQALDRGEIESIITASSTLNVERQVPVFARTANLVKNVLVEEGDLVEKDQVLLLLDDTDQQLSFERSRIQFERAEQDYYRDKKLYEQDLISERVYKEREFEYRQLKLAMDEAKRELDFTIVTAPIGGTIVKRDAKEGFPINIGNTQSRDGVFTIADFSSMEARINVPEKSLPFLKENLPARVHSTALPGRELEAYVQRISPIVKESIGTIEVVLRFKDVALLRPGMYVDVELIISKKQDALLIPKRAISFDRDQQFVYRLKERTDPSDLRRVERILLDPVMEDKFNVEPQSGVFEVGDRIVVNGQMGLKDDAAVRLPEDPLPEEEDDKKQP